MLDVSLQAAVLKLGQVVFEPSSNIACNQRKAHEKQV
jgi:hypothetical protein